jgi:hypothetical protein
VTEPTSAPAGTTGKGRPTPKRSERQKRRTGPVPPPPKTRKEAAARARAEALAERGKVKRGVASGDDRYMMKRDAGPVRRLVRDTVDSRRNIGVLILPLAIVLVASSLVGNRAIMDVALALWMGAILALLVDAVFTAVLIRKRIRAAFPEEGRLGRHIGYGLLRSTVFRRMRLPTPQVSPGSWR